MISLYLLCGAPGSGKTTLSKQLAEQNNAVIISFDELQCVRYSELIPPLLKALSNNSNIIIDSVFDQVVQRKEILNAIKNISCKKILIYMTTPLEECLNRNKNRKKQLPDFVVESFYQRMQSPALDEGWDEILYY